MRGLESSQAKYFREVIRESEKLRQRTQRNIESALALRHHALRARSRALQEWMEISDLLTERRTRKVQIPVADPRQDSLLKGRREIREETKPSPVVAGVLYTGAGFVLLPRPTPFS